MVRHSQLVVASGGKSLARPHKCSILLSTPTYFTNFYIIHSLSWTPQRPTEKQATYFIIQVDEFKIHLNNMQKNELVGIGMDETQKKDIGYRRITYWNSLVVSD